MHLLVNKRLWWHSLTLKYVSCTYLCVCVCVCFGEGGGGRGGATTCLRAAFTVLLKCNICVVWHSAIMSPKDFWVAAKYLKIILVFHFEINFVFSKWVRTFSGWVVKLLYYGCEGWKVKLRCMLDWRSFVLQSSEQNT